MRFGIGRPPGPDGPGGLRAQAFSAAERKELPFFVDRAADAVEALVTKPASTGPQNTFHA